MIEKLPRCDILVVGAGPAGSMAAARTASAGISTLLIDSKRRIGDPPHCAGFVPSRLFADFDISSESIVQKIDLMETTILEEDAVFLHTDKEPNGERRRQACLTSTRRSVLSQPVQTVSPGFIIDRVRFDRALAHNAARQGALVICDTRLIGFEDNRWLVRKGASLIGCKPKYVVAADGPRSTVAKLLGLPSLRFLVGIQVEVPLTDPSNHAMIFLHRKFKEGYGWVFPKGMAANVGVGLRPEGMTRPWQVLESFIQYLEFQRIIYRGALATTRGLIPISGPRRPFSSKNVLFCGDAAGLTHPVSGAGVSQAIISGDIAGRMIVKAMTTNTPEVLMDYDNEIESHFGNVMRHAVSKRKLMTNRWDKHDFEDLCRQSWIAYKGYRKRIRTQIR